MGSSRRQLLQTLGLASLGLAWRPQPAIAGAADPSLLERLDVCSPHDDPLKALQTGNARFAAAWSRAAQEDDPQLRMTLLQALLGEHCQVDPKALAQGQHPWAAVLTCADSRIPVEWIFCAGAGELFGVRSAGNTAFNEGVASLEYAVELLHLPMAQAFAGGASISAADHKHPFNLLGAAEGWMHQGLVIVTFLPLGGHPAAIEQQPFAVALAVDDRDALERALLFMQHLTG